MSDELQELEPLEDQSETPTQPAVTDVLMSNLFRGAPAPAFNPSAHREYYRFLFAGIVMLVGGLMPYGPDVGLVGYKTVSGGVSFIIAIGLVWSMWGAIHTGVLRMKWLLLAGIALLISVLQLVFAFEAPAVQAAVAAGDAPAGWGAWFEDLGSMIAKDRDAIARVSNFVAAFGVGKLFVFAGSLLAEVLLLAALFGGVKTAKAQKQQRQAAAAARRR